MQVGSIKMQYEDYDIYSLSYIFLAVQCKDSNVDGVKKIFNKIINEHPEYEESVNASTIGQVEKLNSHIRYTVDSQGKLTIKGETSDGKTLFDFGKGHHQDLFFYAEEEGDVFYIGISHHDREDPIGLIMHDSDGSVIVFLGNLSHKGNIEAIHLDVSREKRPINQAIIKQLAQDMRKIFKPDSDGLGSIECE